MYVCWRQAISDPLYTQAWEFLFLLISSLILVSIEAKYLFHQPCHVDLIHDTWKNFIHWFHWKVKFTLKGNNSTYNPNYDVAEPSKKDPPKLLWYCELAIKCESAYIHKNGTKIPDDTVVDDTFKSLSSRLNKTCKFLLNNNYTLSWQQTRILA